MTYIKDRVLFLTHGHDRREETCPLRVSSKLHRKSFVTREFYHNPVAINYSATVEMMLGYAPYFAHAKRLCTSCAWESSNSQGSWLYRFYLRHFGTTCRQTYTQHAYSYRLKNRLRVFLIGKPYIFFLFQSLDPFALRQAVVVKTAVSFEGYLKLPRLIHVRLKLVFESLEHLLILSFLLQESIDRTPNQFRNVEAGLLGQFAQRCNLFICEMKIHPFHMYLLYTRLANSQEGGDALSSAT